MQSFPQRLKRCIGQLGPPYYLELAMTPYSISISNESGEKQNYAIFSEAPAIKSSSSMDVKVTTGIIASVRGVSSGHGMGCFTLSKQLYATCGTFDADFGGPGGDDSKSPVGTGTEVIDQRPVVLGSLNSHGTLIPGSLLQVETNSGSPSFISKDPELGGELDCFAIRTKGDFTTQEARQSMFVGHRLYFAITMLTPCVSDKYIFGYCSSLRHTIGPYATFVPAPNQTYQIKPSKVFYITVGTFNARDLAKTDTLKTLPSTCHIDFDALATDAVQLVHDTHGNLTRFLAEEEASE